MNSHPLPKHIRLARELLSELTASAKLSLTESTSRTRGNRETWLLGFRWRGYECFAELDPGGDQVLLDFGADTIPIKLDDGYRIGSETFDSPKDAAAELVKRLEAYAEG